MPGSSDEGTAAPAPSRGRPVAAFLGSFVGWAMLTIPFSVLFASGMLAVTPDGRRLFAWLPLFGSLAVYMAPIGLCGGIALFMVCLLRKRWAALGGVALLTTATWIGIRIRFADPDNTWEAFASTHSADLDSMSVWLEQFPVEVDSSALPAEAWSLASPDEEPFLAGDESGGRILVIPLIVSGIDNATALIHTSTGEPPSRTAYFEITRSKRIRGKWYLVRTT